MNTLKTPRPVPTVNLAPGIALALAGGLLLLAANVRAQVSQTVTWAGGNTAQTWSTSANWSPQVVPLNNPGTNFTVIVPDNTSLTFDLDGSGAIDALSFGASSALSLTSGRGLTVSGVAILKGQIEAWGDGSAFRAPANTIVLGSNPRLLAWDGGVIATGASTYSWDRYNASATLLSAVGTGSLVDLHGVSSMQLSYGDWGGWSYAINAKSNGIVDLSALATLTGPGSDDVAEFNVDTGGQLRLNSVRQVAGNVRFNIGVPAFELPEVTTFTATTFNVATGAVLTLPKASSISSSTFNITTGAVVRAAQLAALDTVPVNLTADGAFLATNLTTYRNSGIAVQPGRTFEPGLLTDIYGSWISVSGGARFRVGALGYEMPPSDWYGYPPKNLFLADGAGSGLDLSSLKSVQVSGVWYGYDPAYGWRYDWTYSIAAANQGVVDLSGLETAIGARTDTYDNNDWLAFKVQSGGNILLPALKQVTRRTRFDVEVSQFQVPALEAVDNTAFNLADGTRLDLPSLDRFDKSSISFGFNSTFSAPALRNYINSDLNLSPGRIFSTPPLTNIFGSRFSVSSGISWGIAATSYSTPTDWTWSPMLLSADGMGSALNFSSLKSLTSGGTSGNYTCSILANNNGLIDLSGLETITSRGDWLSLSVQNGGRIRLDSLREVTGHTRFVMGDGTRFDATNLVRLADGVGGITFGPGSTFNAPRLTQVINSDLSLTAAGSFSAPPLTNIYGSSLAVSGGRSLSVAATSYEVPPQGSYSYPRKTLFSADGVGSRLDLSTLRSLQVNGVLYGYDPSSGWRYDWSYAITATNQGVIDLSGLETLYGLDPNRQDYDPSWGWNYFGVNDWLGVSAALGGVIQFGDVSVSRRVGISASGPDSVLEFKSLSLRQPATLSVGAGTRLRIRGNFLFENTDTNSIVTEFARFQMDGATAQQLEVGGRDAGAGALGFQRTFGYSQLAVGNTNQASLVHLVDRAINGGRGPSGESEALYLYGLEGQGLRLLSGSRLVLGGLNCYAAINGNMVNLKSLLPGGANSVAFDGGWIANFGGPRITNMTPSVAVTPAVSSVDVSFDIPVQGTSFTTMDVNLSGPGGAIPTTSVAPVGGTTWRISFAPQSADGTYTVRVGPDINELAANFLGMDQNADGLGGDGTNDTFVGTFVIDGTAPVVVSALTLTHGTRVGVTFNEPVSPSFATNPASYLVNSAVPTSVQWYPGGWGILQEMFPGIGGYYVSDLTNAAAYPNSPSSTNVISNFFEAFKNSGEDYGMRIHGYVVPPVSGNYTFWIAAGYSGALYLSSDDTPAHQRLIASVASDTGWRNWTSQASQRSEPVFLQAGQRYYICALQKVAYWSWGHLSIRWLRPDGADEGPIPATYLLPFGATVGPSKVALTVPPLVGDSFTLAVNGATDVLGNTADRAFAGTVLSMSCQDVGYPGNNPQYAGAALTFRGDDLELNAGGYDFYWGGYDAGHFASQVSQGDFDVQVQVTGMTVAEGNTQAGLMWRESAAPDARRLYVCVNHPVYYNNCWALIRWSPGAGGAEWPSYTRPAVGSFPNVWLRLKREGDVFTAFRGDDGTNWQQYATVTAAFAKTGLVGPASSARNNSSLVTAWYRNFSDITPVIVTQPQSQSVASGADVTFAVTARGLPALTYQWQLNGVPLPGETHNSLTLLSVTTNRVGNYRVVVSNPYGLATSQEAQLVVDGVGLGGFEADLSPAPLGNNAITVSDWVKVGRMVAGLDAPLNSSEFQRADCAPRTNALLGTLPLGDGRLSVADWTQAGRYAAAVDPLTAAGGPTAPLSLAPDSSGRVVPDGRAAKDGSVRSVRFVGVKVAGGQTFVVPVELVALGGENALGFSVQFDPARLACLGVSPGEGASGASLQVNTNQTSAGAVGVVLARSFGQAFSAGTASVARVQFKAVGPVGTQTLAFADAPVWREIADANANVQPATYVSGTVRVVAPGVLSSDVRLAGNTVELRLTGEPGERYRIEVSADLTVWTTVNTVTAGSGPLVVRDPATSKARQRFYRAVLVP